MSNLERAAEVLYELNRAEALHDGFNDPAWAEVPESTRNSFLTFAKALHDAGLLMPDLPTPDTVKLNGDHKYFIKGGVQVRHNVDGDVWVMPEQALSLDQSEDVARALLAAVKHGKGH